MKMFGAFSIAALLGTAGAAQAQFLLAADSSNDRILLLNAFDGSMINDTFIDLTPLDAGTPKDVIQVGNEIWVSDQIRDRIDRFNANGAHLGAIQGGDDSLLNNIRGMEVVGNTVYVTQGSSSPFADRAVITIDAATGDLTGSFGRPTDDFSPFDVLDYNGELLVDNIDSGNDGIERYAYDGTFLGFLVQSDGVAGIDFPQQMTEASNGNLLVAGFSGPAGVYEYLPDGTEVGIVAAADRGPRGVFELGNGSIMWTNGAGIWIDDELVYEGFSGQYLNGTNIPAAPTLGIMALGGLFAARRRR